MRLKTVLTGLLGIGFLSPSVQASDFYAFPEGFHWGTATAAYQVEGGIRNNWSHAGLDAGEAVSHYTRYKEDFQAAETMQTTLYRMSVEWARIEPEEGRFDPAALAHYGEMLKDLNRRGINPMVTLFHFTLPQWFVEKGGWENEENLHYFERFVEKVVTEFGDQVYYWNTVNEPLVYAFKSFEEGVWPPFKKDRNLALRVTKQMILAHAKAYHIIHKYDDFAKVGFAKNITILEPHWPFNPLDQAMSRIQSYLFNEIFWETLEKGSLDVRVPGLDPIQIAYDPSIQNTLDFIGVNYYMRYKVTASGATLTQGGVPTTDLGWEIHPDGFLSALRLANRYASSLRIPIIVTENGLADEHDTQRPAFLLQHLYQLWLALQEGIPVQGYLHWSLVDNYEWADGYEARFGLMDADRKWRPSASLYQKVIQANGFDHDQLQRFSFSSQKSEK